MKHSKMFVALVAAAALLPLTAPAAYAAVPGNDVPSGAVTLTIGQTWTEDTTEATTDALDAALNQKCGAPFTNASVWFTYTDPTGAGFMADLTASSYAGGFIVTAGDPYQWQVEQTVAAGPSRNACSSAVSVTLRMPSNLSQRGLPENSSASQPTVPASSASCSVRDTRGRIDFTSP